MSIGGVATTRSPYVGRATYPLIIAGNEVETATTFVANDPSTGNVWARIGQANGEHVNAAVHAAADAFAGWRNTGPSSRQRLLLEIADAIERGSADWELLLPTENGRPCREVAIGDIPSAAGIFRYFAGLARDARGSTIPVDDGKSHVYTTREPLGVIAGLIPWNSPLITTAQKLAPALACGNTVVLKPSEFASASVVEFVAMLGDILPPGVVNVLTGFGPDVGSALVVHPDIAKVSFTGGTDTARLIMSAAGEQLTPTLMELGGKSALIVCEDADLELAVQDAMLGIFLANGEVCFASSRLLVHDRVYDAFLSRFTELASQIRVGDALDPSTQLGPLISEQHRRRVAFHVERAAEGGARLVLGGSARNLPEPLSGGYYFEPTIFEDPEGTSQLTRDEVFGPVVVVERWVDEVEVVRRANKTQYGLAAGVWTTSLERAHRMARELSAGMIWVNKWFDTPPGSPMGGVKASGHGRELSADTMFEYTAAKAVNVGLSGERPRLWG